MNEGDTKKVLGAKIGDILTLVDGRVVECIDDPANKDDYSELCDLCPMICLWGCEVARGNLCWDQRCAFRLLSASTEGVTAMEADHDHD